MCSRPLAEVAEAPAARCLLCNVACPVRITKGGPDRYLPDYLPHAGYAGLCGRGSVLVDLLDHPERLLGVSRRADGACRTIDLNTAMQEVSAALRADGAAAILVDGNLDLDTLAATGRLAAGLGASWSVYVPPNDAGLVHGLDAGGGTFIGPGTLRPPMRFSSSAMPTRLIPWRPTGFSRPGGRGRGCPCLSLPTRPA